MSLLSRVRLVTPPNRKSAGTPISLYMKSTVSAISWESSLGADAPRIECLSMWFGLWIPFELPNAYCAALQNCVLIRSSNFWVHQRSVTTPPIHGDEYLMLSSHGRTHFTRGRGKRVSA